MNYFLRLSIYAFLASFPVTALSLLFYDETEVLPVYAFPTIYRGWPDFFITYVTGRMQTIGGTSITFYAEFGFHWFGFILDVLFWFFIALSVGVIVHMVIGRIKYIRGGEKKDY